LSAQGRHPRRSIHALIEEASAAAIGEISAVSVSGVELNHDDFTKIRFGQDQRLDEVARMLRSSTVPSVKTIERPELRCV